MTTAQPETWDQVLRRRLRAGGRRRAGATFAAVVVLACVVVAAPAPAFAHHFEPPGTNGAQLFLSSDRFITPVSGPSVEVAGRNFIPNSLVQVFECEAGATENGTDLHQACQPLTAAQTDGAGGFTTAIDVKVGQYSADFIQPAFAAPNGTTTVCRTVGPTQCAVAAATYPATTSGEPTSQAEHWVCFNPHPPFEVDEPCADRPELPTTTTTPPPPPEWGPAAAMPSAHQRHATAVAGDGRIYVLGGNTPEGTPLATAEAFDPCRRMWTSLPPMPTPRTQFAAAAGPDGRVYAIGGRDASGTPLATVDVYDPATGWSSAPRLALPRSGLVATTAADGRIYAIGGRVGTGLSGSDLPSGVVETYDPTSAQWQFGTPLPAPSEPYGAAAFADGRIYLVTSDVSGVAAIQYYTPGPAGTPGVWLTTTGTRGLLPNSPAVTAGPDGLIYVIGGEDIGQSTRTVRTYDPRTDTWTTSTEGLTTPRSTHTAATGRDGRIYAFGGTAVPGTGTLPSQPLATTESLQVGPNLCPRLTPPADFDGNGGTDYSVFRPSSGTWFAKDGLTLSWGTDGDIPVPADYDGDQRVDVAVFRPSNGVWYVKDGQTLAYGTSGDIPVPADYDGDGKADIAVFRPSNGAWFIHYSSGGDAAFAWGADGDVAVPADYNGDGRAEAAVFRNGVWFVKDGPTLNYGTTGDIPVVADYDDDHIADIAVFRPSNGGWYLRDSSHPDTPEEFAWGTNGDIPVPGDYDGDRIADAAVFRPDAGTWFVETGATASWGLGTDIPLPLPAAVRMAYFAGTS